ncbi:hypothetical protein ACWIGW_16325 [Nocardia brasiliensis]
MDAALRRLMMAVLPSVAPGAPSKTEAVVDVLKHLHPAPTIRETASLLALLNDPRLNYLPGEDVSAVIARAERLTITQ